MPTTRYGFRRDRTFVSGENEKIFTGVDILGEDPLRVVEQHAATLRCAIVERGPGSLAGSRSGLPEVLEASRSLKPGSIVRDEMNQNQV